MDERASLTKELLDELGSPHRRFSHYQKIPDFALDAIPSLADIDYEPSQLPWDEVRYQWLEKALDLQGLSVVEIGSSLGYFCLRLAKEYGAEVLGYEPLDGYAHASNLLAKLSGLEDRTRFIGKGLNLEELADLPVSDLVINLNILHHASAVFDQETAVRLGGWTPYAEKYLQALSRRARRLLFQTGNTVDGKAYFDGKAAVPFVLALLERSGWQVEKIGIADRIPEFTYSLYTPANFRDAPVVHCRRNFETNLVEYYRDGEIIAQLATGSLQRPLWCCKSTRL